MPPRSPLRLAPQHADFEGIVRYRKSVSGRRWQAGIVGEWRSCKVGAMSTRHVSCRALKLTSLDLGADSGDCNDRIDDDRDVERRRALSRSGPRVPPGIAPELHDQITETIDDCGVLTKARLAVNIANCADPFRHAIEFCKLSLERREYRESSQTRSLVRLVDIEVAPDEPLDKWRRPVERPMACDVGKTVVNLDELKVAGRDEWCGKRQAEFVQATLDPAHGEGA
jgi:hypothetical protein